MQAGGPLPSAAIGNLELSRCAGRRHSLRTSACALASQRSAGSGAPAAERVGAPAPPPAPAPRAGAGYGSDSEMGGAGGQGVTQRNRSLRHLRDSRRKSSSLCGPLAPPCAAAACARPL